MRTYLIPALIALVCGVIGAWGYSYFFGEKSGKSSGDQHASSGSKKSGGGSEKGKSGPRKESKGSDEEETGSASNEADTIPGFTTADDADSLRKQIGHLAERLDATQRQIDSLRRPAGETPPDLHTLQIQMVELSRTMDEVASLPSRVRRIDTRLESLEQEIKTIKGQLAKKDNSELSRPVIVASNPPGASTPPSPTLSASEEETPDAALDQAIELFKLGRSPLVANILAGLRETHPGDARVWYFSALVQGLTTGRWNGQAERFAERGVERERQGSPPRAVIDRALQGVTRTQGGDWLAGYRRRIGRGS